MTQLPIIEVYVSYNTEHEEERAALEASFQLYQEGENQNYQIEVKYSEKDLKEGDSIVEFMDKIAVARFVVLFFSKEYFESPYCLYELITANEKKNLEARSFILSIKFGSQGTAINTYTVENIISAWQGEGDLSEITRRKGAEFCQNKLRELLNLEDQEIKTKLVAVHNDVIKTWIISNNHEKTSDQIVQEVIEKAKQAFKDEEQKFNDFIFENIVHELGLIADLTDSWKNYSDDEKNKEEIANVLMNDDYSESLRRIQDWTRAETNRISPLKWNSFFYRIQKIAGWFVLKSINQDWWINNSLSFTDGAKNQGFVQLGLEKEEYSYSEVVVSKALRRAAKFSLDSQNNLIPQGMKHLSNTDNNFVFDSSDNANLYTILIPIVADLKKVNPNVYEKKEGEQDTTFLLNLLFRKAHTRTEIFFYLVTEKYLQKLREFPDPYGSEKSVLQVINERLKDKLFFIAIDTKGESGQTALKVANNPLYAVSYLEDILTIDKEYRATS